MEGKKMGRPKGSRDSKPRKKRTDKPPERWKSSPIWQNAHKEGNEDEPGYNSKQVAFVMSICPTKPLDYNDVPEMERRFTHYLQMCVEFDRKPSNMAAYMAIGIDKDTASDWATRCVGNAERTRFIQKVRRICGVCRENNMNDGKINPVVGIFLAKNYDGLKDQQDIVVTPNDGLGASDGASLRDKYLGRVDIPEAIEDKTE